MTETATTDSPVIRYYTLRDLDRPPLAQRLSPALRETIRVVGDRKSVV